MSLPPVPPPPPGVPAGAPGGTPGGPASGGVVVLLVTHDGVRWLPGVIEGIAEQGPLVSGVVAVDTGSTDGSRDLLPADYDLVEATSSASYPDAVRIGLERIATTHPHARWVWLLHDDSRPAQGALAALLAASARRPDVDVLGPKLREWPSLRRLLELGVTISGTGRRETGLERGEYDQGQHDEEREVLAVNSAGMLVRRDVLEELGGFDPRLPMFGNDLDLGWRAAAAGHATLVVPDAVVFHAEAAHRGLRRTALTGRHTHYQERRAALYTLLVNSSAIALPWRVIRLTLGTFVRMIGFLLVRSVGEALDDLAALVSVVGRPGQVLAGRRERKERAAAAAPDKARVRRLLPPPWLPYRHGADFVGDVVSAATQQASDVAERRRIAAAEADPSSQAAIRLRAERERDEEDELADSGAIARFFTSPFVLAMCAVVVVLLIAARAAFGQVSGGALAPAPDGVGSWWSLHLSSWHELGFGTEVPAPPYVFPLALLGSLIGPTATVSALMLLTAPLALWGAWRFLRVAGRLVSTQGAPRWLLVGGATAYAITPAVSGAWGEGRLGLVVAAAVLPWLAHAALGFAEPEADRRWRAGWRVGLLLALVTAFAPTSWLVAAVLIALVLVAGAGFARGAVMARDVWGPPLTALAVPLVLLSPWWIPALGTGAGASLALDAGRVPDEQVGPLDLLIGRLGDLGAPAWVGIVLLVLALLALLPRATRVPVILCWLVTLVASVVGAVLGTLEFSLPALDTPAGLGGPLLVAQAALVTAVVLGAEGAARAVLGRTVRAIGIAAAVAAAVVPLAGLGWWLTDGGDLSSEDDSVVPVHMVQRSVLGPEHGVLVVSGDIATGLTYTIHRGDGVTLGEQEILALSPVDAADAAVVSDALSRPGADVADRLGALGIQFVLLTAPVDGAVAASLDATAGLVAASSDAGTQAWEVERPLDPEAVAGAGSALRPVLLVLQVAALLLVLVLCVPTIRSRSRA